ncbi:hypothetical protein Micbo1qcDRAFT_179938 [Microdochium bolleyi]|uniref:Fungal lipase-type domain-containing protein n=1 Tax=Microdochium bolleyi TaxID=196109 RepID=A0A136INE3_9PEZI|nr:hypothetical protein Micbo1qcDRAFT_179938 [Microdochium bolleyi]
MSNTYEYNLAQQFYALSAASNGVGLCKGPADQLRDKLALALKQTLPNMSGGWTVSWGPYVHKPRIAKYPQNVWYAAVSESQKYVVVSVAGTAPDSLPAWFNNLDVARVVDFAAWTDAWRQSGKVTDPLIVDPTSIDPNSAYISNGTADGVRNVLSKQSALPSDNNKRVWEYLAGVDPSYTILFAGHSMGGAIAPTMAMCLKQSGLIGSRGMYAMPSAGASPGNAVFNDKYYNQSFKQAPIPGVIADYAVFNTDLFNSNDIVPQAWCLDVNQDRYLVRINGEIYTSSILSKAVKVFVDGLVAEAVRTSKKSKIGYEGIPGIGFVGGDLPKKIVLPGQLERSLMEQHTAFYWAHIGVAKFVQDILKATGCQKMMEEIAGERAAKDMELQPTATDMKGTAPSVTEVELVDV